MKINKKTLSTFIAATTIVASHSASAINIDEILAKRENQIAEKSIQNSSTKSSSTGTVAKNNSNAQNKQQAQQQQQQQQKEIDPEAWVADNGLPPIKNDGPYASAKEEEEKVRVANKKEETKTILINYKGLPTPVELTIGEFEFLEAKKEGISQHLYENYQLEEVRAALKEYYRKKEFETYLEESIPLTADEIMRFRIEKQKEQIALNARISPIEHHIRTVDVNFDAQEPLAVFVTKGLACSVVFFDSTGEPWPIEGEVIGDSTSYKSAVISPNKNILTFTILKEFAETNALITLQGVSTPLVLKLVSNGKDNDDRLSARIPEVGPNATIKYYMEDEFENKDNDMINIVNQNKLEKSQEYALLGVKGTVYVKDGIMFVKSNHSLISPAWNKQLSSTTGQNIYQMEPTTKLLFNVNGSIVQAEVDKLDLFDIKYKKTPIK